MTRLVLAVAVAALAVAAPVNAADDLRLSRGGEAKFPHRSFLLSVPAGISLEPDDVGVSENGRPVRDLSVGISGSTADAEFGTVLAIDASNSMRGAPIHRAMGAARAFAAQRRPAQKLGVVTFNSSARTLLFPTSDEERIDAALAKTPRLAKETYVVDGVRASLDTLQASGVRIGSVIVLSDGADTGSTASLDEVATAARRRGVRLFTVGLASRFFREATLARLARAGDGEFTKASSAQALGSIYKRLSAQLAREYLVRYSSLEGPGKRIGVEVSVSGVADRAGLVYKSPRVSAPASLAKPKSFSPEAHGFWGSAGAMLAVAFGSAFLICLAVASVLLQRRRTASPEQRVAAFVQMGDRPEPVEQHERDALYTRIEGELRGRAWWRRFALDVDIGRIGREPAQIALVTVVATIFTMWLFATISAGWTALFALLIPFGVRRFVAARAARQRTLFSEQLADNLQVIASAMRAGQSFAGALAVAVEDAPEPSRAEFARVIADEQLGVPLDTALAGVVERMDNRDLHQVALVAALQRQAGGNAAEVLDRVSDTIRERVSLRRLVTTLTAQGRLSRWVVTMVPLGLAMFIGLTQPNYLDPLFNTGVGNAMLAASIVMGLAGSLIMKKIADIEV